MAGYFSCLRKLFSLYRQIKKQERYLPTLLKEVAPDEFQNISPAHFKRTLKYWQLGLNVICENLYQLQGKKLNEVEYRRIVLLSVFAPLFDDLFDDGLLNDDQITELVNTPELYVPVNATDRFVKAIYLRLLAITPQRESVIQHLQQVCQWQQQSLKQLQATITKEELLTITYNKSYYSVLLYCALLDNYPSDVLLKLLYPVSGLLQLTNDAFDVWKDLQNGVYTLPNLYRNFDQLKERFLLEAGLVNKLCDKECAITFHALPAMGWMALEQLQRVTEGVQDLRSLSRKQLVCDMDSLPQQVRWIKNLKRLTNQ